MPKKPSLNPPGSQTPDANATIGDAINYTTENPGGLQYLVLAGKWLAGFFAALFKPAIKKP